MKSLGSITQGYAKYKLCPASLKLSGIAIYINKQKHTQTSATGITHCQGMLLAASCN